MYIDSESILPMRFSSHYETDFSPYPIQYFFCSATMNPDLISRESQDDDSRNDQDNNETFCLSWLPRNDK